ncbi:hypothetical protein C7S20_07725 [Christiangramia fulva]|uniref:Uncharacterized protein n=2 Tax=Christiangramia fulva TaxID=2126553 RepID=A0A2R3Z4I8_9FLAO|nr:hypothetical protein C7S20_07725 [Christiangramia fulva]
MRNKKIGKNFLRGFFALSVVLVIFSFSDFPGFSFTPDTNQTELFSASEKNPNYYSSTFQFQNYFNQIFSQQNSEVDPWHDESTTEKSATQFIIINKEFLSFKGSILTRFLQSTQNNSNYII